MISVGRDVRRLGLVVVAGQPKACPEYIQATSRVGRNPKAPGLVCTVFNWARPRDLSHYETFEHYHATFYKHVEPLSVTPFSPGALRRGLAGLLVALVHLRRMEFNTNESASRIQASDPYVQDAIAAICRRAELRALARMARFTTFGRDKGQVARNKTRVPLSNPNRAQRKMGRRRQMPKRDFLRLPVVSASAEFRVMGYLMRRNILAYKAPPNNEGYDLICIHPDPRHKPQGDEAAQVGVCWSRVDTPRIATVAFRSRRLAWTPSTS
jgi:hypothetical protein